MDYFISDMHLGHKNILEYQPERLVWSSDILDLHDRVWIETLKNKVTKDDTLYNLGDVFFSKKYAADYAALPCKKVLIKGNHDRYSNTFYNQVFDEVYDKPVVYGSILLSHEPQDLTILRKTNTTINVHGHMHGASSTSPKHLNICPEIIGPEPKTMSEILKFFTNKPLGGYSAYNSPER